MVATPSAPLLNHRNDTQSSLGAAITSGGQTTITVAAGDGSTKFATLPADILVTYGATAEEMVATDRTGDVLTVTRGVGGGTLSSAPIGTPVERIVGSETFTRLNAALRRSPLVTVSVDQLATGGDGTIGSPWTGWETAVNALATKSTAYYPAGYYTQAARIDVKNGQRHIGAGPAATRIISAFTGDGYRTTNPINASAFAETLIADLTIGNTSATNTGGGIVDIGGSYAHCLRVGVEGFLYGIIYDQSELSSIVDCEISGQLVGGACIWLTGNADHTAGALAGFTNRINLIGNQLNAGNSINVIGLRDDGGFCHMVHGNNFQGGKPGLRICGVTAMSVVDCELEGSTTAPIIVSNLTPAGGASVSIPNLVKLDSCHITPAAAAPVSAIQFISASYVDIMNCNLVADTGQPILTGCGNVYSIQFRDNAVSSGNILADANPTTGFLMGDGLTGGGLIVGGIKEQILGGATGGLGIANRVAPSTNPVGGTVLYATAGQVLERTSGGAFQSMVPTTLTTFTPGSMGQAGNVTFTTNTARYLIIGKLVTVIVNLTITSAGTGGSKLTLALPAALTSAALGGSNPQAVGDFCYSDAGSQYYEGSVLLETTSNLVFVVSGGTSFFGANPNVAVANTDTLSFTAKWELA